MPLIKQPKHCSACKLSAQRQVAGRGSLSPDIIFVGEAPGREEEEIGAPFVGRSGKLVEKVIHKLGLRDKYEILFTNVVRCRPLGNATPTKPIIGKCSHLWLYPLLHYAINNKAGSNDSVDNNSTESVVIVALGASAMKGLLPHVKEGVMSARGGIYYNDEFGKVPIIPTLHPAAVLRNSSLMKDFTADIEFAKTYLEGKIELSVDVSNTVVNVLDIDEFSYFIREIESAKCVAYDVETTGLSYADDILVGCIFAYKHGDDVRTWWLPLHVMATDGTIRDALNDEQKGRLREFFLSDVPKVASNATFDDLFLYKYLGILPKNLVCDCMLVGHLLDSTGSHRLDSMAKEYLNIVASWKDELSIGMEMLRHDDKLVQYAAKDGAVTLNLADKMLNILMERPRAYNTFRQMMLPIRKILMGMEIVGVKVDNELCTKAAQICNTVISDVTTRLNGLIGREINWRSNQQLADVLFGELGLPVLKYGKVGPSLSRDVIQALIESAPEGSSERRILQSVLMLRKADKLCNTYFVKLNGMRDSNGYVHSRYHLASNVYGKGGGTVTGRLSSSNPNMQNVPKIIRPIFVPKDCAYYFCDMDLSQAEIRMLAVHSRDKNLVDALSSGTDIHTNMASMLFNVPVEDVTKERRSVAKSLVFGIIYGMGAQSLSNRLGCSESEALGYIERFYHTFPGVYAWKAKTIAAARKNGYVETMFGRRRYLPDIKSDSHELVSAAERQAVNTPIQADASDLTLCMIVKLANHFQRIGGRVCITVHDSIVIEYPTTISSDDVRAIFEKCKNPVGQFIVSMEYDLSTSLSAWGMAEGESWDEHIWLEKLQTFLYNI